MECNRGAGQGDVLGSSKAALVFGVHMQKAREKQPTLVGVAEAREDGSLEIQGGEAEERNPAPKRRHEKRCL